MSDEPPRDLSAGLSSEPALAGPIAVKIVVYGGDLYTEAGTPLYRYFPLAAVLDGGERAAVGPAVPVASDWPPYAGDWLFTYVPLPQTTSDTPAIRDGTYRIGGRSHPNLAAQQRTEGERQYAQAVYRGWPLYTYTVDTPGFSFPPQGTIPGLFEMVSVQEPPTSLMQRGEDDGAPPIVWSGP